MIYNNGDLYDGYWKDDEKEGKGIMKFKNGEIVDAYWKENKPERGILKYNDIEIYRNNDNEVKIDNENIKK